MEPITYKVYVRTDEQNRIVEINSSFWIANAEGWTQIDEGTEWPKYMHAQANYFPQPIYTDDGLCRYKLEDGVAVERTEEELEAERAAVPAPETSNEERIKALEDNKANQSDVDAIWTEMSSAYREGVNEA